MSCLGLEPRTVRLKAGNSTIELATQLTLAYNDKWIYFGMQVAYKNGKYLGNTVRNNGNKKVSIPFKYFMLYCDKSITKKSTA